VTPQSASGAPLRITMVILLTGAAAVLALAVWLGQPALASERSIYMGAVVVAVALVGAPILAFSLGQLARAVESLGALRGDYEVAKAVSKETAAIAQRIQSDEAAVTQGEMAVFPLTAPTILEAWHGEPEGGVTVVGHGHGK